MVELSFARVKFIQTEWSYVTDLLNTEADTIDTRQDYLQLLRGNDPAPFRGKLVCLLSKCVRSCELYRGCLLDSLWIVVDSLCYSLRRLVTVENSLLTGLCILSVLLC